MSFLIYNLKNEKLNSSELRRLLNFCADNYAGVLAKDTPVKLYPDTKEWDFGTTNNLNFIGEGILFNYQGTRNKEVLANNELAVLEVNTDTKLFNILSEEADHNISFKKVQCTAIVKEEVKKDEVIIGYDYLLTIDGKKYDYRANALLVDNNIFYIPLVLNNNGTLELLLQNRDKSSLESFLTADSYAKLKKYMEETFVWRVGGEEKGNVGDLNITDDTITNIKGNNSININIRKFRLPSLIEDTSNKVEVLVRGANDTVGTRTALPVENGGTNATTKQVAKFNLGFQYGPQDPGHGFVGTPQEGDIYFKILED